MWRGSSRQLPLALDEAGLAEPISPEVLDAEERARGGRWRESRALLRREELVVSRLLCDVGS